MKVISRIVLPAVLTLSAASLYNSAVFATGAPAPAKPAAKPDPKYKVVDPADVGLPPAATATLRRVQVAPPPADMEIAAKPRVVLNTTQGAVTVELDSQAAPLHAKSFVYLADRGFFNNTQFHRYEPGFVIQGGDPLTRDPAMKEYYGIGGPGYQVPRERNKLTHQKSLVIAAARSQDPDSAGSQFYFNLEPTPFLDEGDGYTVFGRVVAGGDNVLKLRQGDRIKNVTVQNVVK